MRRLAPLLVACLAASALRAGGAPTLGVTSDGPEARVFVGALDSGAFQPTWTLATVRSAEGRWSAASPLPGTRTGIVLAHRGMSWLLRTTTDAGATQHHVLVPLTGEASAVGVRIECVQGLSGATLAPFDPWTFSLTELVAPGHLFSRAITSSGSTMEMEVVQEAAWTAPWPDGTRLLAGGHAGATGATVAAVGVTPDGRIVTSVHEGPVARALPELAVPPGAPVAATVAAAGPVVAALEGDSLVAHLWTGTTWLGPMSLPLPRAGAVQAVAASPLRADRRDVMVTALAGPEPREILASVVGPDGWRPLERASVGAPEARPSAPERGASERLEIVAARQRQLTVLRWGVVLLGLPVLVWLLRRLAAARG